MPEKLPLLHPPPVDLVGYFAGALSPAKELEIEIHFASCERCAEDGRRVRLLHSAFAGWTAKSHGAARRAAVLAKALRDSAETGANEQWRDRLERWVDRWAGQAEGAVRVVLRKSEEGCHVLTEGLNTLLRPGGMWQFALEAGPAGPRRRGPGVATRAVAVPPDGPPARVEVLGTSVVEVAVSGTPEAPGPLVLLVDSNGSRPALVAEMAQSAEGQGFIARFENVPEGQYLVVLEPRAESPT